MQREEYKNISKMIWTDHAYVAARNGERYRIDVSWTTEELRKLFESINKDYHLHNRLSYIRNSAIAVLISTIFLN